MLPSDMDLNGKQSVQVCANCQKKCLQVNFLRDSHPPLDPIESISFLVLEGALERSKLTTEPQSNMKGCCLRLPVLGPTIRADIEEDECYQSTVQSVRKHIPLYFTYDCPVQVKYTEVSLGPEEESISTSCGSSKAHEIKGPWTIEIKCGRLRPRTLRKAAYCLLVPEEALTKLQSSLQIPQPHFLPREFHPMDHRFSDPDFGISNNLPRRNHRSRRGGSHFQLIIPYLCQ
jgi:hypothetical protein